VSKTSPETLKSDLSLVLQDSCIIEHLAISPAAVFPSPRSQTRVLFRQRPWKPGGGVAVGNRPTRTVRACSGTFLSHRGACYAQDRHHRARGQDRDTLHRCGCACETQAWACMSTRCQHRPHSRAWHRSDSQLVCQARHTADRLILPVADLVSRNRPMWALLSSSSSLNSLPS
jgi:hypothetical protein